MTAEAGPTYLRLGGGQLLLRGGALVAVVRLVEAGLRTTASRDGITPPLPLLDLVAAMRAEVDEYARRSATGPTVSVPGSGVGPLEGTSPASGASSLLMVDPVGVTEVARVLGVCERVARRRAAVLGVKVGGRWLVERSVLAAVGRPA